MECRFAQFGMKLVAAAREYHPGEPWAVLEIAITISRARALWPKRVAHIKRTVTYLFMLRCRFSRLPQDSEWSAMILGYSGPAVLAIHSSLR